MPESILAMQGVDVYYGQSRVLRDIEFKIPKGQITAIMGRNGVGKTTLLKAILGLLPIRKGEINFLGQKISKLPPEERVRLGIGYVPQGREIFPKLTVEENLRIGLEARRDKSREMPEDLIFDLFPVLGKMLTRMGGNLSGGQQQQLAIARALVGGPKLLILDEPTEGIQPSIIQDIEKALVSLKNRGDFTIVLVEQYFDFARQIADHFCLMERGAVAVSGSGLTLSDDQIKRYLTF